MGRVDFEYELRDEVIILAIGMTGRIESMSIDNQGPMYRVVYWNDSQREARWMYGWEIKHAGKVQS